ncbi:class I SAM-dependent methyltransferase [Acidisoma silvae]|uniref:Class I SAM-dependent methyltransferase n=2 Tax=Acidisoma silvae TaxID=2802396 RepID=A0A963YVN2_9PROT|nr:class I SAM-dependent methyltransferase [Acidisoma silvae]
MVASAAILTGLSLPSWADGNTDALKAAVGSPARSAAFVARDTARHPLAELQFFQVKPTDTVIEIWPGGGYWTQILIPYLKQHGRYIAALPPSAQAAASFRNNFPDARQTVLGNGQYDIAKAGTADVVLTFRNLHDWMETGETRQVLQGFFAALKPGGLLGIEDHRARADQPQDTHAVSGYVRQDYAIALARDSGFVFMGSSEIDANPRDSTHWPKGVWTLPPVFALGAKDHAVYAAVGEADNFVLLFRKP